MTKQDYEIKTKSIREDISKLEETNREYRLEYIDSLIKESKLVLNKQYECRGTKVWITGFGLNFSNGLKVMLNRVKKDGTNGMAIFDSYGVEPTKVKELENA